MISLDQVLLLQKKVETAVAKISDLNGVIAQLKTENDALRSKCAELTNSLSEKTELISNFETEQNKIEQGILSALKRLDTVENSVLSGAGASPVQASAETQAEEPAVKEEPVAEETAAETISSQNTVEPETEIPVPQENPAPVNQAPANNQTESTISGQFDIF